MQVRVHPAAERELDLALTWCREQFGARLSGLLLIQFQRAGEVLVAHPEIETLAPRGIRFLPMRRFPFTLVYRHEGELIHVIALMHQRRKPGYWSSRR